MSEIRTPPSLKWLLDRRARLAGEIEKLRKSYPENLAEAEKICEQGRKLLDQGTKKVASIEWMFNRKLEMLTADLTAIDHTLRLHEIQISPDLIPSIWPHGEHFLPYGDLTRAIYDCLKSAEGVAQSTSNVAIYVASRIGREIPDGVFVELRYSVRHRLKKLCSQGKVIRTNTPQKGLEARWRLPDDGSLPTPLWKQKKSSSS